MKSATFLTAMAVTLWVAGPSRAQDVAAVEKLFQQSCKNCHGPKAQGLASYPKLSDKEAEFIQMRLEQYRAGEKVGPNSPLMIPHARDLTDAEILDLATYVTTAFD